MSKLIKNSNFIILLICKVSSGDKMYRRLSFSRPWSIISYTNHTMEEGHHENTKR